MRTRALLSAGMMGAVMLVMGCSKSEPEQTTPEQAGGQAADTAMAGAGAVQDSVTAAEGAYRDSAAAAAAYRDSAVAAEGAYRDSAAAASRAARDSAAGAAAAYGDSAADGRPNSSGVTPDTTGLGAGADSVRRDSM